MTQAEIDSWLDSGAGKQGGTVDIWNQIRSMELRLRSTAFNAPVGFTSLKSTCFDAADLLATLQQMCRFETHEAKLAKCLDKAIQSVYDAHETTVADNITEEWRWVLSEYDIRHAND